MGTLVKPVIRSISYLASASTVLWIVTLCCDRILALHTVYNAELARLRDEAWLRERCSEPEFFRHLHSHTSICAEVAHRAMRNVFLYSVNHVMQETYVCGRTSCTDQAVAVAMWFTRLSLPVMLLVVIAASFCPVVLLQMIRLVFSILSPRYQLHGAPSWTAGRGRDYGYTRDYGCDYARDHGRDYRRDYGHDYGRDHECNYKTDYKLDHKPGPRTGYYSAENIMNGLISRVRMQKRSRKNEPPSLTYHTFVGDVGDVGDIGDLGDLSSVSNVRNTGSEA